MERIVYIKNYNPPKVDKKEVFRYCKTTANEAANSLLDSCIFEVTDKLSYKVCYTKVDANANGDIIDLGFCSINSQSLARCLEGCNEVIIFAATIGVAMDRLIDKYSIITPSRAVMLQALGSERVEALCDAFCDDMALLEAEQGNIIRPRFSPGYGDLPLEVQKHIFALLNPTSRIGVTLNEKLFMLPQKSVTAIIGVKKK